MNAKTSGIMFSVTFSENEIKLLTRRMSLDRALRYVEKMVNYYAYYFDDSIRTYLHCQKDSVNYFLNVAIDDEYHAEERKEKLLNFIKSNIIPFVSIFGYTPALYQGDPARIREQKSNGMIYLLSGFDKKMLWR